MIRALLFLSSSSLSLLDAAVIILYPFLSNSRPFEICFAWISAICILCFGVHAWYRFVVLLLADCRDWYLLLWLRALAYLQLSHFGVLAHYGFSSDSVSFMRRASRFLSHRCHGLYLVLLFALFVSRTAMSCAVCQFFTVGCLLSALVFCCGGGFLGIPFVRWVRGIGGVKICLLREEKLEGFILHRYNW